MNKLDRRRQAVIPAFHSFLINLQLSKLDTYLLVAYRNTNTKLIDSKNVSDEIGVINFSSQKPMSIIKRCAIFMSRVVCPSLKRETDYGFCTESQRSTFFHGLDIFTRFLKSSEFVMSTRQTFEINNNLYKGNLLANFQIRNTATDYKKVKHVETFFYRWMKQIQIIIVEGLQIQRDNPESGPLQLLEYWRRMLNRYTSVIEFIGTKPFENHYKCLVLSRSSKIITQWKQLDNTITKALNEAKDNVRYITSLQKFWDPVYRHNPFEIMDNLPGLFTAIRNVSKTAHFFNTCSNLTGLLVKVTNQITLSCKAFLTNNHSTIVWKIPAATLLKNIEISEKLMEYYKALYFATIEDMRTHNEAKWQVSSVYIFTYLMKMMERMDKLKTILKTYLTYKVLDIITISGTENCAAEIKEIQNKISARNPDALNYRLAEFDKDFHAYMKSVEKVEDQLREFLKMNMEPLPNTESMLLMIKRYEKLRLECICTDRRYLEVASKLENEIFVLKDVYNSERDAPLCGRNTPPASGRIQWIRMLLRRLTLVMKAVQNRPCVLGHEKSQRTARYFNYMFGLLYHYEITYHKGWFDYADEIKDLIHQPVLVRKGVGTAVFKVNLHAGIRQLINEAERFVKLKIEIPTIALIITYCKEKIINTAVRLFLALRKYDEYRTNINAIFVNICKFQLKDSENLLKPGLSTVIWCSEHLEDFVTNFERSLEKRISFYKDIVDTLEIRIIKELDFISTSLILVLPDYPILSKEYLDRSNRLRQEIDVLDVDFVGPIPPGPKLLIPCDGVLSKPTSESESESFSFGGRNKF